MVKLNNMWKKLGRISVAYSSCTAKKEDVSKLESLIGLSLPDDLKEFLINFGGYKMVPPLSLDKRFMIKLPKPKGGRTSIFLLHSVNINGMIEACDDWGDSLPEKSILMESVGDGSQIFMTMLPGAIGEIYFIERDHYFDCNEFNDYEYEEDACEAFDPKNGIVPNIFSKLADSFFDFIMATELDC